MYRTCTVAIRIRICVIALSMMLWTVPGHARLIFESQFFRSVNLDHHSVVSATELIVLG